MIHVIMGLKGSGKTKQMIDMINNAVQTEHGRKQEDQTAAQQQRTQEGDEGAQRAVWLDPLCAHGRCE